MRFRSVVLCLLCYISRGEYENETSEVQYLHAQESDVKLGAGKFRHLYRWGLPHFMQNSDTIASILPQEVVTDVTCPLKTAYNGQQCSGTEYQPPKYVCPPGMQPHADRCMYVQNPIYECSDGYALRNNRCQTCKVFPANFTCPLGGEFLDESGRNCIKTLSLPPYCPAGYRRSGEQCVHKIHGWRDCQEGYTFQRLTGQCVRSSSTPASVICPEGATEHPVHGCVAIHNEAPRCPRGYSFEGISQRCTRIVPQIPGDCPNGFDMFGFVCQRINKTPATETCPADFEMSPSGTCIKEVAAPMKCDPGFHHSRESDNVCEKIVQEIPDCPAGTILQPESSVCEKLTETDMTQCCPAGFELVSGTCQKLVEHPPQLTCQEDCYNVHVYPVSYACPVDTEFVNDSEVQKCVYSASAVSDCVDTLQHQLYHDCRKRQEEVNKKNLQSPLNEIECVVPKGPPCGQVQKDKIILAQAYCTEGGILEGNQCVARIPIIPEKYCNVGTFDPVTEQCLETITAPVENRCPNGTQAAGLRCISRETIQPNFICPPNSELGANSCCVVRAASKLSVPEILEAPSILTCEYGKLSRLNKSCLEITRSPRNMGCPQGAELIGDQCMMSADFIVTPPFEKPVRPTYRCPDDGMLRGQSCWSVHKVPSSVVCPDGTYLTSNDFCERRIDAMVLPSHTLTTLAIPECPRGAQTRGTSCVMTVEIEPLASCNPGFEFEGNQCVAYAEKRTICPYGSKLTPQGCLREVFAAPSIKVIRGCTHKFIPSCQECESEFASTCFHD